MATSADNSSHNIDALKDLLGLDLEQPRNAVYFVRTLQDFVHHLSNGEHCSAIHDQECVGFVSKLLENKKASALAEFCIAEFRHSTRYANPATVCSLAC